MIFNFSFFCNWDSFGSISNQDPGQKVDYYEVGLGDNPKQENGRTNVHFFVNVGLERKHTFIFLSLVPKTVTYYCTVRANSKAATWSEGFSNGVRVGYRDFLIAGKIEIPLWYPINDTVDMSWSNFISDFPMIDYRWAISSTYLNVNHSLGCPDIIANHTFDIEPWNHMQIDTSVSKPGFNFTDGQQFYVIMMAFDSAAHCDVVCSDMITIDTTVPIAGKLGIGKITFQNQPPHVVSGNVTTNGILNATESANFANVIVLHKNSTIQTSNHYVHYIPTMDRILIEWSNFYDNVSYIVSYTVGLFQISACKDATSEGSNNEVVKDTVVTYKNLGTVSNASFFELNLLHFTPYYVHIIARDPAGYAVDVWSLPILIDSTPPIIGDVKDGAEWAYDAQYHASLSDLKATFNLVSRKSDLLCKTEKIYYINNSLPLDWMVFDGYIKYVGGTRQKILEYGPQFVGVRNHSISLNIVHDTRQLSMVAGGVYSPEMPFRVGNYTTILKAAYGRNVVTAFSFGDGLFDEPMDFTLPVVDEVLSKADFDDVPPVFNAEPLYEGNKTEFLEYLEEVERNRSLAMSLAGLTTTTAMPSLTPVDCADLQSRVINGTVHDINGTSTNMTLADFNCSLLRDETFANYQSNVTMLIPSDGVGIHIMGWPIWSPRRTNLKWLAMVYMKDRFNNFKFSWFELFHNPTETYNEFKIDVEEDVKGPTITYNLRLYVNGQYRVMLAGLKFQTKTIILKWRLFNLHDYVPPVTDPFNPYSGSTYIQSYGIPSALDQPCYYGNPSYDFESQIDEVWAAVGSRNDWNDSVVPWHLYSKLCHPCVYPCDAVSCEPYCNSNSKGNVYTVHLTGLNLTAGGWINGTVPAENSTALAHNETRFETARYYIFIRLVNRAGLSAQVRVCKWVLITSEPP